MISPFAATRTPIALDIGSRRIKAAQLARKAGEWRIESLASISRDDPGSKLGADEVARIRSALSRQGFVGSRIILAVPNDKLMTGVLDLPQRSSDGQLEQMARMEIARLHGIEPNSFEVACWRSGASADADTDRAMAVACPHKEANELLSLFENAGFEVDALDAHPCALARACQSMLPDDGTVTPVMDIGWSSAWLLLTVNGQPAYERLIDRCNMALLVREVAERFDLDVDMAEQLLTSVSISNDEGRTCSGELDELFHQDISGLASHHCEGIIEELQISLSYVCHQYHGAHTDRLIMTGGCANIAGLAEHLGAEAGLEAIVATPADVGQCDPAVLADSSDAGLTQAVGIARFGLEQGP